MERLPSEPVSAAERGPNFREIAGILRRNLWTLLAFPLIGLVVGLWFASTREPVYEASAMLLVGKQPEEGAAAQFTGMLGSAERIGTEIEVLRSRRLAKAVVDSLGLQLRVAEPLGVPRGRLLSSFRVEPDAEGGRYLLERQPDGRFQITDEETERNIGSAAPGETIRLPGAWLVLAPEARQHPEIVLSVMSQTSAASVLLDQLEVAQPGEDVNLIRVSYSDHDRQLAQQIPNALTARYIVLREAVQKAEARNTATFLREQLDTLARQLTAAEERLRSFRESAQVIDPQVEASTQVGHLAQLQAERSSLEAERASLAQLVASVQSSASAGSGGPSPYRRLIAFPTLLRNEVATELLGSLSAVEAQRTELLSRRTADDPDVQLLNRRIVELEAQLQSIVLTYLQGLSNQVAATDATLAQSRDRLGTMPAKEVQFARLSRQPRVLQGMYELLQTRLKEVEIAEAVEDANVRVLDAADLPAEPAGAGGPLFAGGFALLGLLVGVGLVFAREYADQTVRTRADVQAALGIPVLGLIPAATDHSLTRQRLLPRPNAQLAERAGESGDERSGGRLIRPARPAATGPALYIAGRESPNQVSDAFNRLHSNIMFVRPDADLRTLLLTSPLPGDGKTTTAVNLAVTLARSGLRVLLIDADLRRGRVHELFDEPRGPGLANLLSEAPVGGVLRTAEIRSGRALRYIPAGDAAVNPAQLLGSAGMRALLDAAAQEYDRVIVDSPPLNLFPDAAVLSQMTDGIVIVARAGSTPFDALVDAAEHLRHTRTPVLGAVLNGVDFDRDASYDTSYRWYRYTEAYQQTPAGR